MPLKPYIAPLHVNSAEREMRHTQFAVWTIIPAALLIIITPIYALTVPSADEMLPLWFITSIAFVWLFTVSVRAYGLKEALPYYIFGTIWCTIIVELLLRGFSRLA